MADDKKKPKIDLKARLKQTTQVGLGAPTPMPMPPGMPAPPSSEPGSGPGPGSGDANATGRPSTPAIGNRPPSGITPGIAPPPGLSPGIPLPPFGQPMRPQPQAAPKLSGAQQTIKVDVGEEIEQERKKSRTRILIGGLAGAVIGIVIGFAAGGASAKGERHDQAKAGAGKLEKDVKAAGDKLKELDDKLTEAGTKLENKSFPDDLATALAGLTIPFESATLDGKDVGSLSPRLLKMVLNFTSGAENINKSRESLRNVVGIAKDPITKAWKEETAPVANFSVVFRSEGGKTVVAELVPNKEPFAWKPDGFQPSYKVVRQKAGKPSEESANRWQKGDLPGNDLTAVPIDPKSTAAFSSEALIGRLRKGIYDMRVELEGNKDNPTNETPGLVKTAEDLANELRKTATAN